jgi:predicted transcriptional regulator
MGKVENIGRAELEVLRYVQDHHPASVRQVAEHFAESKGHVRTTILTVLERLRKKGYLFSMQLVIMERLPGNSWLHQQMPTVFLQWEQLVRQALYGPPQVMDLHQTEELNQM